MKTQVKLEQQRKIANNWRKARPEYKGGIIIVCSNTVTGWRDCVRDPQDFEPGVVAFEENGTAWHAVGGDSYNGAERWEKEAEEVTVTVKDEAPKTVTEVPERVADKPLTRMVNINAITSPKLPSFDQTRLEEAAHVFIKLNGELPTPLAVRFTGYKEMMPTYELLNLNDNELFKLAAAKRAQEIVNECDCITAFVFEHDKQAQAYNHALAIFDRADLVKRKSDAKNLLKATEQVFCP